MIQTLPHLCKGRREEAVKQVPEQDHQGVGGGGHDVTADSPVFRKKEKVNQRAYVHIQKTDGSCDRIEQDSNRQLDDQFPFE